MPDPSISPTTIGPGPYTINSSNHAQADVTSSAGLGDAAEFTLQFPTAATVQVTLIRGGTSLNLLPTPAGQPFPNRSISVNTSPSGGNTILTCDITVQAGAVANEPWSVQVSGLSGGQCVLALTNFLAVTRVMSDPVAGFTISAPSYAGGAVQESDSVTLHSLSPLGIAAAPTVVGAPAPVPSYSWRYTGPLAIMEFNAGCALSPNFVFTAPAVYGDTSIALTLETWFDSTCPTPGFLDTTSAAQNLTIKPRTQLLMLVLDRTGSMAGPKWDNASAAARMLAQLFAWARQGVSTNDKAGIMVFEDASCTWHIAPRDPSMDPPILPLSSAVAAGGSACSVNLGNPGSCTPIGDALMQAMQDLHNAGATGNPAYTIALLTDGIENSGGVKVDPGTTAPGLVQNFSNTRTTFPDVNNSLRLYTIGVGTDSQVQGSVLNQLSIQGNAVYRLINDPTDIIDGIAQIVSFSLSTAKVPLLPGNPINPDPGGGSFPTTRYFDLAAKASRLAILLEWGPTDPSDAIQLAYRVWDSGTGSYHGPFTPLAGVTQQCPTHGLLTQDLAAALGSGSFLNVPASEWRLIHTRSGANQAIQDNQVMVLEDLVVKAEIVFDKAEYGTGDEMVITCLLRDGDQPIRGAHVTAELSRPGEGMGTFLSTNALRSRVSIAAFTAGAAATGGDPASAKLAMLRQLLDQADLTSLPYQTPPSIFTDGSNELFDDGAHHDGAASDGIYGNVYNRTDKEGSYTWRFTVTGNLADGSPFYREITLSKWVGVNVDPITSPVTINYNLLAPSGFGAAEIFVTPLDSRREYLGPFWPNVIGFATSAGTFQGDVTMHPDGRYSQVLVYPARQIPLVTVSVQGKAFVPTVVASGCLGSFLLWLRSTLLRLWRRLHP